MIFRIDHQLQDAHLLKEKRYTAEFRQDLGMKLMAQGIGP
ncbi:hypothetical protein BpHYR1_003227, partial [Brachionus plicatilis]